MSEKKTSALFRFIKWCVKLFYPKTQVEGIENLPDEPVIIVGNHCQMNGPIVGELYVPGEPYIWCAGEMMHLKDVPEYAFRDFWSQKPKWTHPFYKLLSYIIAPLSACVFTNADTIPVFRDNRLMKTFKQSIAALQDGANVIVFPECYEPHNHIVYRFQDKFIDVARLHYNRTGTELSFVPLYIAPALKKMYVGRPVRFNAQAPKEEERRRICTYLMNEITDIAVSLPKHLVVPYPNLPKKDYPVNQWKETEYEKTGR